ncbi:MAG: hypothetical protein ACK55I_24900, partial [bacterium]
PAHVGFAEGSLVLDLLHARARGGDGARQFGQATRPIGDHGGELRQAAVHGAAHVARAGGQDGAHEGLARRPLDDRDPGHNDGNGRLRRGRRHMPGGQHGRQNCPNQRKRARFPRWRPERNAGAAVGPGE